MPYQDPEEVEAAAAPRVPTAPERWLRKLFLDDWGLKLLALAITVALWLGVTGQNKPVTLRVNGVQVNFVRPDGLELSNDVPGTIDVILAAPKDKLDRIEPRELIANIDLTDQKAGERLIRLSLNRVNMDLPEDVKIQAIHPASISVRLEPIVETPVDVEVKFEGKLPDGYELGPVTVSPTKIRLRGPADRVSALKNATTETVSLDGKKESFNMSRVAINIPDPRVDVLDPAVDIRVEIIEKNRGDLHLRFAAEDSATYLATLIPHFSF